MCVFSVFAGLTALISLSLKRHIGLRLRTGIHSLLRTNLPGLLDVFTGFWGGVGSRNDVESVFVGLVPVRV